MPRILVIEDDRAMVAVLRRLLHQKGYRVLEAHDGAEALQLAMEEKPDLVLLDVGLPLRSGFRVCADLRRAHFDNPILMVTGRYAIEDRVLGLEAGADDYLTKPYDERELLARIHAQLRRVQRVGKPPAALVLGDIRIDFERRTAERAGAPLALTKTEFALLEFLARNHGRPSSRKAVLDAVWNYARTPTTRTVDTHIWRLRKKLGNTALLEPWIRHVPGSGYLLHESAVVTEQESQSVSKK